MRCWTGVVRSLGMGGRLMSANAPVATRTGSHLARIKRGAMIQEKNEDTSTGQISSLDHNRILQRNAGYLSPTNRPGMVNKCAPGGHRSWENSKVNNPHVYLQPGSSWSTSISQVPAAVVILPITTQQPRGLTIGRRLTN